MTKAAKQLDPLAPDRVEMVLNLFAGDTRATIGALLDELQHVRGQLALTEAGMSVGFTRGWTPSFESEETSDDQ